MNLILYSRSIHSLDILKATTSSENFELNLVYNISKFFDEIYIISKSVIETDCMSIGNIKLIPIKNISEVGKIQHNQKIFKYKSTIILFFGYDYITLRKLKIISRKYDSKLVSFTFDTHRGAIENKKVIKKWLLEIYFKLGIFKLNTLDGILLFQQQASKELKLKIPFLISRMGINKGEISEHTYIRNKNNKYKILYTGSLEKYNGIKLMIDCMKYIKDNDIIMEIYGDGSLRSYVEDNSKRDSRIKYKGKVSRKEIQDAIKSSDILLNLRDTSSIVSKYAFPSKLIEYLASGIPVLSTDVIDDNQFHKAVFLLKEYNDKALADKILDIKRNSIIKTKKVEYAKEYLINNYMWDDITYEIYEFFRSILK